MFRIATINRVLNLFGAGKDGFKDGDLVNAVRATEFSAAWSNGLQEELMSVIEGGGVVPGAAVTQVFQAIKRLAGINVTTVNAANSPFNLTADNAGLVIMDAAAGAIVANLPAVNVIAAKLDFKFIKADSTANIGTGNCVGADTMVGGATSFTLKGQGDFRCLSGDAVSKWGTTAAAFAIPAGAPMMWPVPVPPIWALVRDGSAITRAVYPALFAALCPTRSGTTANAANTLTGLASTTDLYVGMPIEGAGIPAGTTIATITGAASATMSANATASATVAVRLFYYGYGTGGSAATFGLPDDRGLFERGLDTARSYEQHVMTGTTVNAANTVTALASTRGLYVGMPLVGLAGVPGGTTVASITSATAITMSANATASASTTFTFSGGQIGSEKADSFKQHNHQAAGRLDGAAIGTGVPSSYPIPTSTNGGSPVPWSPLFDTGAAETRPKYRTYLPIIAY